MPSKFEEVSRKTIEEAANMAAGINEELGKIKRTTYIDIIYNRRITGEGPAQPGKKSNYPYYQSGGTIGSNTFATDLNIPLFKGEAVLPSYLVRAIKEGRGSFAGLSGGSSSINLSVNVTGNNITSPADEDELAEKVGDTVIKKLRLNGVPLG